MDALAPDAASPATVAGRFRGALAACKAALVATSRLALDVALPTLCVACRAPVSGEGVCPACWAKLSFIAPPLCARLGIPFVYDPGPGILSMEAIADPPAYTRARAPVRRSCRRRWTLGRPAYTRARAPVRYDDVARTLVHGLKYQDRTDLAPTLGRWMARAGAEILKDADLIVPVPLHWRRGWSRRYNQSGALATVIGRIVAVPVAGGALKRIRPTPQQIGLSRSERARNVQGAFLVPAELRPQVEGRRLVLVDDVLTTGATVDACARALLRAKAANVDVLVFARVVEGARNPI